MSQINAVTPAAASGSFVRQMGVLFAMVLAVALLGVTIGYLSLNRVSADTTQMVDEVMSTERITAELQRHILINVARNKALALSSEPQVGEALLPEINATSQEQMTQQNAAAMQEAAASARSLQHRASGLRDATNQFRLPSRALTLLPTAS